jgi:hypothetical protein
VDREVQAEAEQLALAPGEPVRQITGVAGGGLGAGVIELAAVGAGAAPRFQPGALAAQPRDSKDAGGRIARSVRVRRQGLEPRTRGLRA